MSDAIEAVEARIAAVLCDGRGIDGALGPEAQASAIAAKTFRRTNVPLDDPSLAGSAFDRALYLRWSGSDPVEEDVNTLDPERQEIHRIEVHTGYLHGAALSGQAHLRTGETAATAVKASRRRAHSDASLMLRALSSTNLVQGGLTGVEIVRVIRTSHRVDELADGRVVSRAVYELLLAIVQ